jgi:hypothetical protein
MPELMIFKAGKYPQGEWSKERVQKMVDAYDPEKNIEAPVVIGHRYYSQNDQDERAHGWVKRLRMDGAGKVYADVQDLDDEVLHAIANKNLRYISAEIYEFDKRDANEAPYLRAISLLGRSAPAVQGTKLPTLFGLLGQGTVITFNEEEHIAAFTRRMSTVDTLSFGQYENIKKETMEEAEKLKAALAAKEAELAQFKAEFDTLKSAGRKQEAETYFGALRDSGKLTPALAEQAVALDVKLGDEERKSFRALFGDLNVKIDLSGTHAAPKSKAPAAPVGDAGLAAKIRAFQKEKNIVAFEDAAEALYVQKPELFTGGEA